MNLNDNETNIYTNIFIFDKELRAFLHILKSKAYENNGVLYGDIVINSIVAKYYKNKFLNKYNFSTENFWNTNFDIETKSRTITSKNFDVYFKNINDYIKFNDYIKNNKYEIIENIDFNNNNYIHNKYKLINYIGSTITWIGAKIELNINITTNIPNENYMEPPFNMSYFTTDLLIMKKNSNGPIISNNTGILYLNDNEIKQNLLVKLIYNISNYNIHILCNNNNNNNYIAKKYINYLINGWNIINSPIKTYIYKYFHENNTCLICLDDIQNNKIVSNINYEINDKNIYHKECLIKYLNNKIDNDNELVCPYRKKINFTINNINLIIDNIINSL